MQYTRVGLRDAHSFSCQSLVTLWSDPANGSLRLYITVPSSRAEVYWLTIDFQLSVPHLNSCPRVCRSDHEQSLRDEAQSQGHATNELVDLQSVKTEETRGR